MIEVVGSNECGNSPKNKLVETLAIALSMGNMQTMSDLITNDVQWIIAGDGRFEGKEMVRQALELVKGDSITKLTIRHVLYTEDLGLPMAKKNTENWSASFVISSCSAILGAKVLAALLHIRSTDEVSIQDKLQQLETLGRV